MEPIAPSSAPFLSEGRPGSSGRIRTLHGGEDGMQINRFASQSQPQNATRSAERRRSLGSESDRHSAASREVTASHRASQFLGKVSTLVPQRRSAAMGPAGPPRGLAVRFSSRAPVGLAQGQTLPEGDAPRGAPNCDNPPTAVGVDGVTYTYEPQVHFCTHGRVCTPQPTPQLSRGGSLRILRSAERLPPALFEQVHAPADHGADL